MGIKNNGEAHYVYVRYPNIVDNENTDISTWPNLKAGDKNGLIDEAMKYPFNEDINCIFFIMG